MGAKKKQAKTVQKACAKDLSADVRVQQVLRHADDRVSECRGGDLSRLLDVDRSSLLVLPVVGVGNDGAQRLLRCKIGIVQHAIHVVRLAPSLR